MTRFQIELINESTARRLKIFVHEMEVPALDTMVNLTGVPNKLQKVSRRAVLPSAGVKAGISTKRSDAESPEVPTYLREIYDWAYLNPRNVRLLDREFVVATILWGNHNRLRQSAFEEIHPGQQVLQSSCVYGDFSPALARQVGSKGRLQVFDVAPIQVERCRRKLRNFPQASVRLADAAQPSGELYDAVCCYFLLHEIPADYKRKVVDALLGSVVPGGKVVFVDYHRPHFAHPLKVITSLVFDTLEPFAKDLWRNEISDFASAPGGFVWRKQTYFGGLFQKVIASRPAT
jgi:SAM-dependent methyltransferase